MEKSQENLRSKQGSRENWQTNIPVCCHIKRGALLSASYCEQNCSNYKSRDA